MNLILCNFKDNIFAFVNDKQDARTPYFMKEHIDQFIGQPLKDPKNLTKKQWEDFLIQTKRDILVVDKVRHCVSSQIQIELNLYDGEGYFSMADAAEHSDISRQLFNKYLSLGKVPSPDAVQGEKRLLWKKKNIYLYRDGFYKKNIGEVVQMYSQEELNRIRHLLLDQEDVYVDVMKNLYFLGADGRTPVMKYEYFSGDLL